MNEWVWGVRWVSLRVWKDWSKSRLRISKLKNSVLFIIRSIIWQHTHRLNQRTHSYKRTHLSNRWWSQPLTHPLANLTYSISLTHPLTNVTHSISLTHARCSLIAPGNFFSKHLARRKNAIMKTENRIAIKRASWLRSRWWPTNPPRSTSVSEWVIERMGHCVSDNWWVSEWAIE